MTASTNNRDLDRAVAEALGAEIQDRPTRKSLIFPHPNYRMLAVCFPVKYDPSKINPDWTKIDEQWWATGNLPNYSTNITAAIEALEEFCKARGYGWAVDRKPPSKSVIAFIFKFDDPTNAWCGEGEIATAICRAIVAAAQEKP